MSVPLPEALPEPSASARTADADPALERGLEALAFLERSRALAAEPVEPPGSPFPGPDRPPGRAA